MKSVSYVSVIVAMILFSVSPLSADLRHRYSFETNADDSVGVAHAALTNGAVVSAGQVACDGSDDFVDLPAATIAINTYSALTLEMWSTQPETNQGFSMTACFGDTWAGNGTGQDYLMISTTRGNDVSRGAIANTPDDDAPWNDEVGVDGPELNDGLEHHYALTVDATSITYYIDGVQQGAALLNTTAISGLSNTYAHLAKGLYTGDGTVNCTINEFRIYDAALSDTEIQNHYQWGPDSITEPLVSITESDTVTILYTDDLAHTDTYEVVLLQQPTDDVMVTLTPPTGLGAGSGSGTDHVLTFTDQDWDQPQTVTVSIADAGAVLGDVEIIQHTVQSNDTNYDGLAVRNVSVYIEDDSCGVWGYLEADYNMDCDVNLEDFAKVAGLWLGTEAPLNLDELVQDWLLNTFTYDQTVYERSIQKSSQPYFVNTANVVNAIDEKVYGHFLEHIYHSANNGLWGDTVWNRSFEMDSSGGGIWSVEGSDLVQSSTATDIHMEFGDPTWTDYELTLQAQKDGGAEAFLILFRAADADNFYWFNIGGWGNSQHAIQKEVNGVRSDVTSFVPGSMDTGVWYDVKIRCEGNNFKAYIDDSLIFDYTDTDSPITAGAVGLGTWATQARYRNIQVTDLAGTTVLYSGLPTLPGNTFGAQFWTVFGNGDATMETDALNDDYSVQIVSDGTATGLLQDNYAFIPQAYTGSLWMKGSMPAGVSVELMDGDTVLGQATLGTPTSSWAEYPFSITPTASTNDGSLRISLLGAGTVLIDQVSMMGQDAIDIGGYRPDLFAAVDDLRPPLIRWPGGCFASAYLWKDGIGPQEDRVKYPINLWDDQDTNSYGTDEFLRMCEAMGTEPLICVNIGLLTGTCGVAIPDTGMTEQEYIQDVLDWMEYCNGDVTTTWGAVRAANGHPAPYNVTYWEVDNETWSTSWGGGIANYVAKVQAFVPEMQAKADELGTPIKISAVGGSGTDMSWNQTLIDNCATLIDYISVHHYEGSGGYKSGPVNYDNFLTTLTNYIAASANPEMKIYNSEWNLQTTDWRTGLFAGGLLNVYEKHGDTFEIGGPALFLRHTSATGWDNAFINFDHTGWFAAPNYVIMKLWWDHYAPNRVEMTGDNTNLNVVATMTDDQQTLYIRVVNADAADSPVEIEIDSSFIAETACMHYVDTEGDLYARNTLADPEAVSVQAKVIGLKDQVIRFNMPAYSAGIVTVKTTQPHKSKYLYSSFQGNGDGLHLAYSEDGLTFNVLKNDETFVTPTIGSGLMRDPSIAQGPDGMFHMVWTTGWNDDGIGIAHSADLINWSAQTYLPVMADQDYVYNCWAPEIFYDEATGQFLIVWSTTLTDGSSNDHRAYYIATDDFVTYTDTALFYDPGWSCIDAFLAKDGDRYAMVIKDERDSGKNIRITFSDNAAGPYEVPPSASITPAGLWVEGPSIVKVGQQWVLYYDAYTNGYMGGMASTDMETWTDISGQISFPSGTRHGTVFKVTEDVLDALKAL